MADEQEKTRTVERRFTVSKVGANPVVTEVDIITISTTRLKSHYQQALTHALQNLDTAQAAVDKAYAELNEINWVE